MVAIPFISAACTWMSQTSLHLFYSLSRGVTKLTTFSSTYPERQQLLLDDDFDRYFMVLDAVSELDNPITYIQSVEGVLADFLACTATARISQKHWLPIRHRVEAIRVLLHDYFHDLERASNVLNHRCFTLNHRPGDIPTIPEYAIPHLKELCLSMKHVIGILQRLLQRYSKVHKFYFWMMILRKELEQRYCDLNQSLENLTAHILPKLIYQYSLGDSSHRTTLHVMESATPKRYRLVDCSKLTKHNVLCITEFVHFPHVPYVAVSYVWRGNSVPSGYCEAEFSVTGAEEADPISVEVLHDACVAALARGAAYLWIDRLCIMQTSKDDKNWQIREMFHMYRCCVTCIVIPGGLRRLVPIDEETGWIHRGWTLQEALAPPSVFVIFSWKLGRGKARSGPGETGYIEEVVPGRSAITSLSLLVDACTAGFIYFEYEGLSLLVEADLFSSQPSGHMFLRRRTRHVMSPNVAALAVAMSESTDFDMKQHAIWKSALMRTSSRPVDMVFSIMGLFGVTLDTRAFDKDDRMGATIALARQVLCAGGRASWLGASFHVAPSPCLSTFSTFPRTRVSGKAFVRVMGDEYCEVSELVENEYPVAEALIPMPQGTMDEDGYLIFDCKAVRIVPASVDVNGSLDGFDNPMRPMRITALDGSAWVIREGEQGTEQGPATFAVLLGFFSRYYPGTTPIPNESNVRAMLVEEHAPGKLHLRSYFMLSGKNKSKEWVSGWTQRRVRIGGPDIPKEGKDFQGNNDSFHEITIVRPKLLVTKLNTRAPAMSLEVRAQRRARWAVPQHVLEKRLLQH